MKKNIHIISHSHWDREWYMPFEYHRARLVKLVDTCMELFENDSDFKCFYLDGHTALIEDYLEIKPQNREKLKKYISEKRFWAGPWYVLQDEFLTSAEANVRNLLVGIKIAKEFGNVSMVGYFPDSFGNAGQMPQLLKQAGMKAIAFGRGVKPTGMNNTVSESSDYASNYSELYWESPDGTKLPAILFANWYNNGVDLPEDGNKKFWDERIENVCRYASTDELLFMNGSDHMPPQTNLSSAISAAKANYPEYNFVHDSMSDYVDALLPKLPEDMSIVTGELTSQNTDGWWALINTASSHAYLKRMNRIGEITLENVAEPLSAIAACLGMKYPHEMLEYSWKTLMKNHPHDSICGCSVDEVNDEMRMRFMKSRQAAETVINAGLSHIADCIDTSALADCDAVFAVVNTHSKERNVPVETKIELKRIYGMFDLDKCAEKIKAEPNEEYYLVDENHKPVSGRIDNVRLDFGYDLPDDSFRRAYMSKSAMVSFEAENLPPMGYKLYGLMKGKREKKKGLSCGKNKMENQYVSVTINKDGTIDMIDKKSGRKFSGLLNYEDVGDVGNEYTFVPINGDVPILSSNGTAKTELISDEEYMTEYKITSTFEVPESADESIEEEMRSCVHFTKRSAGRSTKMIPFVIETYVSLAKNDRGIRIRTEFLNNAKNHRLRVLIPTGLDAKTHRAETVFDATVRNNRRKPCWTYPSKCDRQQGFVMMRDEAAGIAEVGIGLYEYEILEDNTIALTLVRAVGELGDWGVFPTELAQCQRKMTAEYQIVPFENDNEAYSAAAQFECPPQCIQIRNSGDGSFKNGGVIWSGDCIKMTAFKNAMDKDYLVMRWVNYSDKQEKLTIKKTDWINNLYMSNVMEEKSEKLEPENGEWILTVKPHEILTLCGR